MTVKRIRLTLLSQSSFGRRNSTPGAAHSWPDADPAARRSSQSGQFTLPQRAFRLTRSNTRLIERDFSDVVARRPIPLRWTRGLAYREPLARFSIRFLACA